jgi:hypothetical protein
MEPPAGLPVAEVELVDLEEAQAETVEIEEAELVGSAAAGPEEVVNPASARTGLTRTGWKEEPTLGHRLRSLEPSSPCVSGVLD